jgi:hypothetical protein
MHEMNSAQFDTQAEAVTQTTLDFEQADNLQRIYGRVGQAILAFFAEHASQRFHLIELLRYIRQVVREVAPDSPGRIMRLLRRHGRIDYAVVSRSESLYEIRGVAR